MTIHPLDKIAKKYQGHMMVAGGLAMFLGAILFAHALIFLFENGKANIAVPLIICGIISALGLGSLIDFLKESGQ